MSQAKTTAKKPTKQQLQAEREKSLIAQGYYEGLEVGRCEGHSAGYRQGCIDESWMCDLFMANARFDGEGSGKSIERIRWTQRGFWSRLRYLINPNHTI